MPILVLLGPFKGVFGPPVGSGAPGEPNFPNNQTDPIFFDSIVLIKPNGSKKSTLLMLAAKNGPKIVKIGQKWPKIAIYI